MYKNILVGIDGSKHAKKAAEQAIELAKQTKGKIFAIMFVPEVNEISLEEAENYLKVIKEMAKEENIEIETKVKEGYPNTDLAKFAKDNNFDLIVLGSHGKTGLLNEVLLGSVSESVTKNAQVDVLIIKATKLS